MIRILQIIIIVALFGCNSRENIPLRTEKVSMLIDNSSPRTVSHPIIFGDYRIFPDSSLAFGLDTNNISQTIKIHFLRHDSLYYEFNEENRRCGSHTLWNFAIRIAPDSLSLHRFRRSPIPSSSIIYEVLDGECIVLIAIDSINFRRVTLEFEDCLDESESGGCATQYIGDLIR